jgi:hypothetical protein
MYCVLLELGMAQRKFAQCLGEFQFEYIGDAKTDDEKCIGKFCLYSFPPAKQDLVWILSVQYNNTKYLLSLFFYAYVWFLVCTIDNL